MQAEPMIDGTETEDVDLTQCDHCGEEFSQVAYDAAGAAPCPGCAATTFICAECEDRTFTEDAHKTHSTLCESCGDSKDEEIAQERLDAAKEPRKRHWTRSSTRTASTSS